MGKEINAWKIYHRWKIFDAILRTINGKELYVGITESSVGAILNQWRVGKSRRRDEMRRPTIASLRLY